MLTDLNDLFFFASVVDHQGFAPAGRALGIPKSKLSRRVALLEERLGVRLIQRSTRRFSVTELGQTYYAHCKAMLVEAEAAQQAIEQTRAEPCGTVRMSCPVAILHTRVGSMVAAFMADYPKVTVHLEATNRRVDVVGEGLDLAIRVRPPPLEDSDLVLKILAQRTWCVAASPALVRTLGPAQTPEDLRKYPAPQALFNAHAAVQRRRLHAVEFHLVKKHLHAGLLGEAQHGALQRLRRNVEILLLCGLRAVRLSLDGERHSRLSQHHRRQRGAYRRGQSAGRRGSLVNKHACVFHPKECQTK